VPVPPGRFWRGRAPKSASPDLKRRLKDFRNYGRGQPSDTRAASTSGSPLERTLSGWAVELDDGRKFWWADWTKLIGDAITAVRTGERMLYPDDEDT
jgi:hypothetical protein